MSDFDRAALGKRVADLNVSAQFDGYSGVEIVIDQDTSVFAGDRTGRVLTVNNPWGTQAQAENTLAAILGFQYQPFRASSALLSPAAELGDAVSINGIYSGVYALTRKFSPLMEADVSAPQDEEVDHEYPYESKKDRGITRRFSAMESEFVLQANQIAAKVSQTGGDNTSFGWQLLSDHFSLFSGSAEVFRVDAAGATVRGVITATSGQIGGFTIGKKAIYNNIPDFNNAGGISSGVYVGTDGIRLGKSFTVAPSGALTAKSLTLQGTITFKNDSGTTVGTMSAANLRSGASYGHSYGAATTNNTQNYPTYFTAANLRAKNRCDAPYVTVSESFNAEKTFKVGGIEATWKQVTINGTTIKYLGRS